MRTVVRWVLEPVLTVSRDVSMVLKKKRRSGDWMKDEGKIGVER